MQEQLSEHPTGYEYLDNHEHYAFSRVGDAIRRLWYWRQHGTDDHFVNHTKSKHDRAGRHLAVNHGRARKLESFLGPVVQAPYALFKTVLFQGTYKEYVVPASKENFFTNVIRYAVFSISCYLYAPKPFAVNTQLSDADTTNDESVDGAQIKVLRLDSTKMCFPASKLPTRP
jgi:hypothetical protein